ncbi:NAD(P)-dependent oxidoreductase [uncultured Halopseudomonas sp.]|uniref:NAD-dependent epimerase/dehydratase family protein n=1 Tax=uncultured Halopseudomonas sp. TaxID=2901193 RepID=UPI0030ED3BA4|tara:strand:+ start:67923 stop:68951 length:1029 start_codon:yes stop_codon:yes gene_type:complete
MRILITGASGFIGGRFAADALSLGLEVRCTGRNSAALQWLGARGAECLAGDLLDADFTQRASRGCEAIMHCAGAVGTWGSYQHFHDANVRATEHVLASAVSQGVRRLVHLSSPSIYFDGKSHRDVTEDFLPPRFFDHYGATKHLADQKVFAAGRAGLEVIALRPRFVIGAGDTSIFPRLLRAHQSGRLRIIGNGNNHVDLTPVENLNLAMHAALEAPAQALGRAYNISNGQPVAFWPQFNALLARLGMPELDRHIPFPVAYAMAAVAEAKARLTSGQPEPAILRLGMAVMARDFNLDISAARTLLGYQPRISIDQGIENFAAWWQAGMPLLADYLPSVDTHR